MTKQKPGNQMVESWIKLLRIRDARYDHETGQLQFVFDPEQVSKGQTVVLIDTQGNSRKTRIRRQPRQAEQSALVFANFPQCWLRDLAEPLMITSQVAPDTAPAACLYRAAEHEVLNWSEAEPNTGALTVLISYPRSGSNFLQNILSSNSHNFGCASAYQMGRALHEPKICLKSHALNPAILRNELNNIWGLSSAPRKHIVLVRDPRDVFMSLYDYVSGKRETQVKPDRFLETDFYWYLFKPDVLAAIRDPDNASAVSVLQAYKDWVQSWLSAGTQGNNTLFLRYEDLVISPNESFTRLFDWLGETPPKHWSGLGALVSQNGESSRARGRALGWRHAPAFYQPIIDQVNLALADEIQALGYVHDKTPSSVKTGMAENAPAPYPMRTQPTPAMANHIDTFGRNLDLLSKRGEPRNQTLNWSEHMSDELVLGIFKELAVMNGHRTPEGNWAEGTDQATFNRLLRQAMKIVTTSQQATKEQLDS